MSLSLPGDTGMYRAAQPSRPIVGRSPRLHWLEARNSGKPVLAFLFDPESPWPLNRVDAMWGAPGVGEDVSRLRALLGTDYLAGIFRTPDDLSIQVAGGVSAQGVTRYIVDRVLCDTSVVKKDVDCFARGSNVDSSTLIGFIQMLRRSGAACALVLELDEGPGWWSTRLFLLASLLRSVTTVRQLVFCDTSGRFAGLASPTAIFEKIASSFPGVERGFARVSVGCCFVWLRDGGLS